MTDRLKMAHVLMLTPSLYRCGPMNDVLRLCRQYTENGFRPLVAQINHPAADSIEDDFHTIGIDIITFGGWRWNMAAHVLHLREIVRHNNIDIVHSISLRPDFVTATLRSAGNKFTAVSTALNIAVHDTSALIGRIPGHAAAALWLAAFKRMDAVAAHSQGIFDYLCTEGLLQNKMRVIPNGVDTEHFTIKDSATGIDTRQRLGIGTDDFVLGFAGNFLPVKGLDILLRAFTHLHDAENMRLMLIGDGPEEIRLRKLADELGISQRLLWIQRNSELRPYYAAMDVFCLPSRSEGLSNALLEAGACGLPCLVTDIAGSSEVVKNGINGYVVPPENETALTNALEEFYRQRADLPQMGAAARKIVCASYSAQSMARSYMQLYEELLSKRN